MELVETPVFTRQVTEQFSTEEYRAFQLYVLLRPDAGAVIPASNGLRYPKNVRSDLTQREVRILRSLIRDE